MKLPPEPKCPDVWKLWRKFRKTVVMPPTNFTDAFPETLPGRIKLEREWCKAKSD